MIKHPKIKDSVWIHIGEPALVKGRVVDIIDFAHLKENHDPNDKHYVIEIETGIQNVYEVRNYNTISFDENGPINLYKNLDSLKETRLLKQIGIKIPVRSVKNNCNDFDEDLDEPTPEEISAALERSQQINNHEALILPTENKPKKRFYKKKPR
jgi:hypothetical protein